MVVLGDRPQDFGAEVRTKCTSIYELLLKSARPILQHGTETEASWHCKHPTWLCRWLSLCDLCVCVLLFSCFGAGDDKTPKVHAFRDAALGVLELMHVTGRPTVKYFGSTWTCVSEWEWVGMENKARAKTHNEIIKATFKPAVVGRTGGRPAFSLFQMYRCMILNPGLAWHGAWA